MAAIHVHLFSTLDGSVEDPSFTFPYGWDAEMGKDLWAVTNACQGILLGRNTYEMFEPAWSTRTVEDDEGAPFFNDTRKFVVSSTLTDPTWNNSEVIGTYDADRIRALRDEVGDLYISGSLQLVRALLADRLVDHLHLFVYPVALGEGERLFVDGQKFDLKLNATANYANGVVHLDYGPAES